MEIENYPQPAELFEHFKGGIYEVITLAQYSEYPNQLCVVYRKHGDAFPWVRPLSEWLETVNDKPRFKRI